MIREAKINDLPAIIDLVKELAVYEKEPEAVSANLEMYEKAFSEGVFEALVLEEGNKILGMALYYMTFSTWKGKMLYLEDFIISQEMRNKGLGQQLFDAFIAKAAEKGAILTKWQVLDWNKPAINFYLKNKAIIEKEWLNAKIYL